MRSASPAWAALRCGGESGQPPPPQGTRAGSLLPAGRLRPRSYPQGQRRPCRVLGGASCDRGAGGRACGGAGPPTPGSRAGRGSPRLRDYKSQTPRLRGWPLLHSTQRALRSLERQAAPASLRSRAPAARQQVAAPARGALQRRPRPPPAEGGHGRGRPRAEPGRRGALPAGARRRGARLAAGEPLRAAAGGARGGARGARRAPRALRGLRERRVGEEADGPPPTVPLEAAEHEWLVSATAGQWSPRLHGLLLHDRSLASKRDFMTGFTVLHWAAKTGNCDMLQKVIEVARADGAHFDVNAQSFGGYTPLHIAALHGQEDVIVQLVKDYNAKVSLRDYSGKKPFQYLREGSSFAVRHLLRDPNLHTVSGQNTFSKKNAKVAASILSSTSTVLGLLSDDTAFYELTKGLKKTASLNRLLHAATASRRRLKRVLFPNDVPFSILEMYNHFCNSLHWVHFL
uniref:Sosondowah ankyrin repeat domain family member A n=1 Tax=Varanus komodoensis TaxID=61221 RepID=A0A8D2L5P1_VARKO